MADDISVLRYEAIPSQGGFQRHKVSFTWGVRTKPVTGILKLVQQVVKMMLTTPGSDQFFVDSGTIIPGLVQKGVSRSSVQLTKMDIMVSVQDLERQIQDIQANQSIPDEERLREIDIRRVEYLEISAEWQVDITVISHSGEGVTFDVGPFLRGK